MGKIGINTTYDGLIWETPALVNIGHCYIQIFGTQQFGGWGIKVKIFNFRSNQSLSKL